MRPPLARTGTAVVLAAAVVAGTAGSAAALPLPVPVPSVSVPQLPLPTPSVSVPPPPPLPTPTLPRPPGGGGITLPPPPGSDPDQPGGGDDDERDRRDRPPRRAEEPFLTGTRPMIAGRPEASGLLDDESSPALLRASKAFLAADQGIAEIVGHQHALLDAVAGAQRVVDTYDDVAREATTSRHQAVALHDQQTLADRRLGRLARSAYRSGGLGVGATETAGTWDVVADQLAASAARAELRLGRLAGEMAQLRQEYEGYALAYYRAKQKLDDYRERLERLAAARAAALAAARAARASDVRLTNVRQVESGLLGQQIRAASEQLRAAGDAVQGTGVFGRPGRGEVTSPYGPRFHPILRYTKLHTGTDLSAADGTVYAADDGVVLFTVFNRAYGNMTVVDHGVIDGRSITTMYAHQARFLVEEGDRVEKGQPIGVIGSTGYSTGPHLHFEVRDAGTVVDPMPWLRR